MTCVVSELFDDQIAMPIQDRLSDLADSARDRGGWLSAAGSVVHMMAWVLCAPAIPYLRWRRKTQAFTEFGAIDVHTLDDIGLLRNRFTAATPPITKRD